MVNIKKNSRGNIRIRSLAIAMSLKTRAISWSVHLVRASSCKLQAPSSKLGGRASSLEPQALKKIQPVVVLFIIYTTIPNHLPSLNDFVG